MQYEVVQYHLTLDAPPQMSKSFSELSYKQPVAVKCPLLLPEDIACEENEQIHRLKCQELEIVHTCF